MTLSRAGNCLGVACWLYVIGYVAFHAIVNTPVGTFPAAP